MFVLDVETFDQPGRHLAWGSPESRDSTLGFLSSEQIGHRSNGVTRLLSATVLSAAPVLQTAAATKVAGDLSDEVEPSSPT